jgi:Zn finger protein HypA/HybF involved in hydrogenase expression
MFVGTLNKKKKVDGYIKNNLFQPREIYKRHNELAIEMIRRGMKHKSTMHPQDVDIFYLCNEYQCWEVDKESALKDLISRCPECKKRMEKLNE